MANPSTAKRVANTNPSNGDNVYDFKRGGPVRKSAEELADVIDVLNREHGHLESLLDTLEQEAAKLRPGRIPDYHLLLDIIDYLTHYPDLYHHPREDLLFGSLLQHDAGFQGKLDRLLREHETLHHYSDQLFAELGRVAAGAAADRVELEQSIDRYVEGYRQHMRYESREIFPEARGALKPADLKKLAEKTRYRDDPLFGDGAKMHYRRVERKLRAKLSELRGAVLSHEMSALESTMGTAASTLERLNGLRENLPGLPVGRLRARLNPFAERSRPAPGPSWQARAMNTCFRLVMKPLMQFGSIDSMRSMIERVEERQEQSRPEDIDVQPVHGDDYQGEWVRIAGKRPRRTLLYFPGGGFVMRSKVQHRNFVTRLCRAAHARALIVHYRLAPETPFPGGLEDCLAAYHDLLRQGCKPEDITIAGDSAGGGLVLSTLLALRDEGSPMPARAVVLSPLADLTYSGESREFNSKKDPMIPNHRASHMHQLYMGEAVPEDRYLSPVLADFDGLPPMLGLAGSTEILLDDTVRAAQQAKKAGVPFHLEIWNEMPHCFPLYGMLPEGQVAVDRIGEYILEGELDELEERYGSSDPDTGRPGH